MSDNIEDMFSGIASRYDLANHLLSFGLDFCWRKKAVKFCGEMKDKTLLDMCCGTGDLAFCFARHGGGLKKIIGCDISGAMIEIARAKEGKLKASGKTKFEWFTDDCEAAGLEGESFDVVSCGFGVRNMANLHSGLCEMYRVLKQGGRACILEFSLPQNLMLRWVYKIYLCGVLPFFGGIITGKFGAYRYFSKSVVNWSSNVDLCDELIKAGFGNVSTRSLTFGTGSIYTAKK